MITLYRWLLKLYPQAFRDEFEKEMLADFRRRWQQEPTPRLALATLSDLLRTAAANHGEMLAQDLRYGLRTLRQSPAFAISAIVTLALAIGATTAIFSLVHAVLLRPLPMANADRVVRIYDTNRQLRLNGFASSEVNFLDWTRRARAFESLTAFRTAELNLTRGNAQPERVSGFAVQGSFWKTIGRQPLAGRDFTREEQTLGKHRVVLLGDGLWRRAFAGDTAILGQSILLSNEAHTVIGIAPANYGFASSVDFLVPLPEGGDHGRGDRRVAVVGRLREGVTAAQAAADLNQIAEQLEHEYPKANRGWRVRLESARNWVVERAMQRSLTMLFGAVGLLLLLACANIANLMLARAAARQREIGVRLALGASRGRLGRQVLTESLLLGALGGAAGIALAVVLVRSAPAWLPADLVAGFLPEVNTPVLAFAVAATLVASLAFGCVPALLFSRGDVRQALTMGRTAAVAEPARLKQSLAIGQMALATTLLIGALLMVASFARMMRVDLGIRQDHLLTARFNPPMARITDGDRARDYYDSILREVAALPGVSSAAISSEIPLGPVQTQQPAIATERAALIATEGTQTAWRIVTRDYFQTLGIRVLRGDIWSKTEGRHVPVLISESLRRKLWAGDVDPLGRMIRLGNGRDYVVTGVVSDVKQQSLTAERPTNTIYLPPWWTPWPIMTVVLRTNVEQPATLTAPLRAAVLRADPAQPLYDVRTMEAFVSQTLAGPRLAAMLLASLALVALALAAVGVGGLASYAVERRRPELALRLALGATPGRLIRQVAAGHAALCAIGLALGIATAWWLRPAIGSLLFQVQPGDPLVFASAGAILLTAGWAAAWIPARRVTRIDPAVALRGD